MEQNKCLRFKIPEQLDKSECSLSHSSQLSSIHLLYLTYRRLINSFQSEGNGAQHSPRQEVYQRKRSASEHLLLPFEHPHSLHTGRSIMSEPIRFSSSQNIGTT